jgi:hypothetical protein
MSAPSNDRVRWRLQFGVRTFLIGVTIVSVLFAFATAIFLPWYRDRSKLGVLNSVNAQVFTEPRGQFLFREFFGDTVSQRSIYLHLKDPRIDDDWLRDMHGMPHIEVLSIKSANVTDVGLMELKNWPNLMDLNLVDTQVTDSGIEALRQSLPSLRIVRCSQSESK